MGRNDRLSRDQKLKAKLKKRAAYLTSHMLHCITGTKYKTR